MDITLERGGTLRIDDPRGMVVEVKRGLLWLTQEGDARDRYLGACDWQRLDRDGVAVVSAIEPTVLELCRVRETILERLQRLVFHPLAETA